MTAYNYQGSINKIYQKASKDEQKINGLQIINY